MNRRSFLRRTASGLLWVPVMPAIIRAGQKGLRDPVMIAQPPLTPLGDEEYVASSATLDGTNDYMSRGADLTGNADGKKGTISFWFQFTTDGTSQTILYGSNNRILLNRATNNRLGLVLKRADGTNLFQITSSASYTFLSGTGWHHWLCSWDLSTAGGSEVKGVYFDGAGPQTVTTFVNDTIDYTQAQYQIGAANNAMLMAGCLAEVFVDYANSYDLSNSANRELFRIAATGKPADIPANIASTALANPIIYMKGSGNGFNVNSGTGGNFTVTGDISPDCGAP